MTSVAVILPARYKSSRLPGKVLRNRSGKYLMQYGYEASQNCDRVDQTYIATPDERVAEAAQSFGGRVIKTGPADSGTSRVAMAVTDTEGDYVINLQADAPDVGCRELHGIVDLLEEGWKMATLSYPLRTPEDLFDPHCVKVVTTGKRALYFSRAPIPWDREQFEQMSPEGVPELHPGEGEESPAADFPWQGHAGLYGFHRDVLTKWNQWEASPLARREDLEQLKALEQGVDIGVNRMEDPVPGIDSKADYQKFLDRH